MVQNTRAKFFEKWIFARLTRMSTPLKLHIEI